MSMVEKLKYLVGSRKETPYSPVSNELRQANFAVKNSSVRPHEYAKDLVFYLEYAARHGLDGTSVVLSCRDLAKLHTDPMRNNTAKRKQWNTKRKKESLERIPRLVEMKLYTPYFFAIKSGEKTFEGRAYKPDSPKKYHDLREGDNIIFTIDKEVDGWQKQCVDFGLNEEEKLKVEVGDVVFGSTVHEVFQTCPRLGWEFQPMFTGVSELFNLRRAAVYYSFPNYPEIIDDNGFIGIEILNPRLL